MRRLGSVVVSILACHSQGWGIDLRWTHLADRALEIYIATLIFFL